MSVSNKPLDDTLDAALQDARARGLPDGWSVTYDKCRKRKKWVSPAPHRRLYDSVPRALAAAEAELLKKRAAPQRDSSTSKRTRSSAVATAVEPSQPRNSVDASVMSELTLESKHQNTETPTMPLPSQSTGASNNNAKICDDSEEDDVEPVPESDPETSLDLPKTTMTHCRSPIDLAADDVAAALSGKPTTVHWDPYHSPEGTKVGYRIRVFDEDRQQWKNGRIICYDPMSHKHKILFSVEDLDDEDDDEGGNEEWLRLKDEIIQCGARFVWAHVKGFPWWPAQVMDCQPPTVSASRDGYVFVEFFGSDQVATVKDTPECIRQFERSTENLVNAKNKRKRNAKATGLACQEQEATVNARNNAARFFAEKAFHFANRKSNYFLGKRIQFFRSDIDYPKGATVSGVVRQYSVTTKKWLISYNACPENKTRYEPSWVNFIGKEYSYKCLDKSKGRNKPTDVDLYPYLFGHTVKDEGELMKCSRCSEEVDSKSVLLNCAECRRRFHPGCLDPPYATKAAEKANMDDERWVCSKCTRCIGCRRLDIAFGTRTLPPPPSLYLEPGASLDLCSSCIPLYEKDSYCPTCAHVWDDAKYQKWQRRLRWQAKLNESVGSDRKMKKQQCGKGNSGNSPISKCAEAEDSQSINTSTSASSQNSEEVSNASAMDDATTLWTAPSSLDPSWFYSDSTVWGYNEGAMLVCDGCNLWVHARCANLTLDEYDQTNNGMHPIYSKEFLCRTCCKRRAQTLVNALQNEDGIYLFAVPVTEKMAHNYHDVIRKPMDLQTMLNRADSGAYHNYAWVRESFELMVLNALTFNRPFSKYWSEAKRFYEVCLEKVFQKQGKGAPPSKFGNMVLECFEKAQRDLQAEKYRMQEDATAEKKDLVAGAQVISVKLAPLVKPPDPPSCVPFVELRLSKVEAFFCSWMECCFTCGSSGASDTMLFCVDCGEAYHSFCVHAPIHSMNQAAVSGWRCPNCKVCEISGEVPEDETQLLYCEMCDRAFALSLLEPPLKEVPIGLWICGQCVDCKVCKNVGDKGRVSKKFWSQDPQICFRCGGCSGLAGKFSKGVDCPVCKRTVRTSDEDLVQCRSCKMTVHGDCDMRAKDMILKRSLQVVGDGPESFDHTKQNQYTCPLCRKRSSDKRKVRALQIKSDRCESDVKGANSLEPNVSTMDAKMTKLPRHARFGLSDKEFNSKLGEEIAWQTREMWRDEYRSVINDGEVILNTVEERLGKKMYQLVEISEQRPEVPHWLATRAARFMRYVKRGRKKNDLISDKERDIKFLTIKAQMASAFLRVACLSLSLNVKETVKCWRKMRFLAGTVREDCGIFILSSDEIKDHGHCFILDDADWMKPGWDRITVAAPESHKEVTDNAPKRQISKSSITHGFPDTPTKALEEMCRKIVQVEIDSELADEAEYKRPVFLARSRDDKHGDSEQRISTDWKKQERPQETQQPCPVIELKWNTAPQISVTPLIGWNSECSAVGRDITWKDPRPCSICHLCGDEDAGVACIANEHAPESESSSALQRSDMRKSGRLLPMAGGLWVHAACAIWSSEVWESPNDGLLHDVEKARHRGSKLKCFGCGRPGATLGCHKANCCCNYHLPCAKVCGSVFTKKQQMFCKSHQSSAQDVMTVGEGSFEIMKALKVANEKDLHGSVNDSAPCHRVGALVVHSLGRIEQNEDGFHSMHHITPLDYTASRIFWSYRTPKKRTLYILKIERSVHGSARFSIMAADAVTSPIRGDGAQEAYTSLIELVRKCNEDNFSTGDFCSVYPVQRVQGRPAFGLNGPQFFGFGLDHIRRALETCPGTAAVAAPLTERSVPYQFCFVLPDEEEIMSLQRKRAASAAEKALENSTGCARTEGISAITKSGGSGRITRALVKRADEDHPLGQIDSAVIKGRILCTETKIDFDSNQAKYKEMKSMPLSLRLAARRSHIHGWGLFSKIFFPKHSMIVEYMGETVRQCVADRREREYEMSGIGSCYMFRLDSQRIVDATRIGCMARFMNHCCSANAYAKVISVYTDLGLDKKIVVFANRDIAAGEEITYDYKFPVEDGSLRCTCGAPNCIGRMN